MKREKMRMIVEGRRPSYANAFAAGLDLTVRLETPSITFKNGDNYAVRTGVKVEIPHGYFGLVAIRSGLGAKGLILSNGIGVIDEDYRGEIRVPLYYHGDEPLTINDGERVAQFILVPYVQAEIEYVEALSETDRGEKGFGSSGRF